MISATEWTSRLNHKLCFVRLRSCCCVAHTSLFWTRDSFFFFFSKSSSNLDFCYIYFFGQNQQAIELHWGQLSRSSTLPISTPRPQTHYILLTQPSLRHLVGSTAEGFVFLCWASCSGEQGSDTSPRPQAKKANNKVLASLFTWLMKAKWDYHTCRRRPSIFIFSTMSFPEGAAMTLMRCFCVYLF